MSDIVDINVNPTVEEVTIDVQPNVTVVNVNTIQGIPEAPIDGEIYGRQDASWEIIPPVDVSTLVPYTGATQDVNLGEFGTQLGNIEFDNTPTNIPTGAGSMYWNDADGTTDLILKGGNVKLQVGQESVIRVVNKTATNVDLLEANYQAVRVTGAQGQRLKVDLAQATNDLLSAETIGLVTETINNNQEGFITTSGLVRNINTTGSLQSETWADGDILYLSPTTAGRVTKVKPIAPNHLVIIGYVVSAHATQGSIFVKVDNGYELDELHNVKITGTPSDNSVLAYTSATEIWENKTVATALGFTPENVANKATTLTSPDNTKYPTTQAVVDGLATKFTLPALTSGSVLFSNGSTIAQDNSQLFWDDTNNRLGIGTNAPATPIEIRTVTTDAWIRTTRGINTVHAGLLLSPAGAWTPSNVLWNFGLYASTNNLRYWTFNGTTDVNVLNLFGSTANVAIGTNTDAGFRLDVNGTTRLNGNTSIGGAAAGARLDVRAQGALSTDIAFRVRNSADSANLVDVRGNTSIGFGTSASGTAGQFDFGGANAPQIRLNGFFGNATIIAGSGLFINNVLDAQRTFFQMSGTTVMSITRGNNILIGGTTDIASAILNLDSTTKGFLPPRMTNAQRLAIASPAVGLMVYCTDATEGLYVNKSTGWTFVI